MAEKPLQSTKKSTKRGNPQNLKPWQPGQSGNPAGRKPKGMAITDIMRSYLDGTIDTAGGQVTRGEALARAIYGCAMKGDVAAQKLMINYIDGLPVQKIEQTNITPITEIKLILPEEGET